MWTLDVMPARIAAHVSRDLFALVQQQQQGLQESLIHQHSYYIQQI